MQKIKEQVEHLEKCRKLPAWSKVPPRLKMRINSHLVESRRYLAMLEKLADEDISTESGEHGAL